MHSLNNMATYIKIRKTYELLDTFYAYMRAAKEIVRLQTKYAK